MRRSLVVLLVVLLFSALIRSSVGLAQTGSKTKINDKIASKAVPFDLQDVRLLDGPFREAMLRDQKYLLELDSDRLLHNFRVAAGLPSSAAPLGGWEDPKGELRGHSVGHYLTACALMYASTGDVRFKTKADGIVAELAKVQEAMPSKGFHKGFLSAYPEEFFDRVDKRIRVWAPYYTLHKIMAGLLDMYALADNRQALEVVSGIGDWLKFRIDRLTDDEQQAALETEHGGMNESLANLYAFTGNPEYLRLALKFNHKKMFDAWASGVDNLDGLHGNTQFPKVIGAFREYQLTGEKRYLDIANFFWDRVALHRSFAVGGNTDGEHFVPIAETSKNLGPASTECCNTYNMLKLTRQLFGLEPSAVKMDFYERGLFNQILGSQDPETGMMSYYLPMRPGAFKTYSTPHESFWCCVGTGMENHSKYGDTIYFHDDKTLYLNLFIASELSWKDKGLTVRQETRFPEEDATRLTFRAQKPVRSVLKIRVPYWAQSGITITVNGKKESLNATPASYASLEREWKSGDTVEVRLPMSLHLEAMPDDPAMVAVMYGPIVLAGDLTREGLTPERRYGPNVPQINMVPPITIPAFVGDLKDVVGRIKPVPGTPLNFETAGLAKPADVRLHPVYKAADERFTVYWKVYSPAQWEARNADLAARESHRRDNERRTLDAVAIGDDQSEKEHNFQGQNAGKNYFENKRTRDARNGWFSFDLKVTPDRPAILACAYSGTQVRPRGFDVFVDGVKVATENRALYRDEAAVAEYKLPADLTRGKGRVTVKFQTLSNSTTGSVWDVRIVQ